MEEVRNPLLLQILRIYNYRMRALREEKNYTMKKLAELAGVSPITIGKFESLQSIPQEKTLEKIAYALDTTIDYIFPDSIRELIELKFPHKIGRPVSEDRVLKYVKYERLRLENESSPERKLLLEDRSIVMDNVLSTLTKREKEVVKMFYGIGYNQSYNLEEIGEKFKLTRERIRQIKEKAIGRLRNHSRSDILREYITV